MAGSYRKPVITNRLPKEGDPRLGELLASGLSESDIPVAVIIGFPCDEGVKRNGGRPGAAKAPSIIREAFYKLTPDAADFECFKSVISRTRDLGDLVLSGDLSKDQIILGEAVASILKDGSIPVILGGGHETSYGHFLGYVNGKKPVKIVNIDAHPDVRPLVDGASHSGSPFREALLHPSKVCQRYTVAGLAPHSTSKEHLEFISKYNGHFIWNRDLNDKMLDKLYTTSGSVLATFDLDAVDQAFMPAASAPAVSGLKPGIFFKAVECAGKNCSSFDLVEFNPNYDVDSRGARTAAFALWSFFKGLSERSPAQ